ncbi:MAG TPA: hypothetical protein VEO56_15720 [Bacteroidota bacterium]|nr:hypothetical protein [Bacteroidota bacterium]
MNLGQMIMVIGAIALLGILILNANTSVYQASDTMYTSEFGVTAISLATSLVDEAMGKDFDSKVAATATFTFDSTLLTAVASLGPEATDHESYRKLGATPNDFNDFDDFNGLKLCYHSTLATDSDNTPGFIQMPVSGMRAKYYVTCSVCYVNPPNLDAAFTSHQTWHKKIVITVWSPSAVRPGTTTPDTLVYPAIMSYWN